MILIDHEECTKFARDWLRDYVAAHSEELSRAITKGAHMSLLASAHEQIEIAEDGRLIAPKETMLVLTGLEFGSGALGLPRLGILSALRAAFEEQAGEEAEQFQ